MKELKRVTAETNIEINLRCPHCGDYQDRFLDLHDLLDDDCRASDIEKEVTCIECNKAFIVEEITY